MPQWWTQQDPITIWRSKCRKHSCACLKPLTLTHFEALPTEISRKLNLTAFKSFPHDVPKKFVHQTSPDYWHKLFKSTLESLLSPKISCQLPTKKLSHVYNFSNWKLSMELLSLFATNSSENVKTFSLFFRLGNSRRQKRNINTLKCLTISVKQRDKLVF